jgi:hypothetical protein
MSKNTNTNTNNVELTPAVAMDAMFPQQGPTAAQAMDALFPTTPDPVAEKLGPERTREVNRYESDERRTAMIDTITKTIADMGSNAKTLFKECAIGDELHPDKLAIALQKHLPSNWTIVLDPESSKTPNEQLAAIAVRIPRAYVSVQASIIAEEIGLSKDEQTRAIRKVIKQEAMNGVSKQVPLRVAKATKATRRDAILAALESMGLGYTKK